MPQDDKSFGTPLLYRHAPGLMQPPMLFLALLAAVPGQPTPSTHTSLTRYLLTLSQLTHTETVRIVATDRDGTASKHLNEVPRLWAPLHIKDWTLPNNQVSSL